MKTIKMIYAKSRNGVIGSKGSIPWNFPQDMAHFKELTMNGTVVMGRKTWESIPPRFRPLPGRDNIVISRDDRYEAPGAIVVNSLERAIEFASLDTVWIIGGSQIYQQALHLVSEIHVTLIHQDYEGDAFAPVLTGWRSSSQDTIYKDTPTGKSPVLTFVTLIRDEPAVKSTLVYQWKSMDIAPTDGRWVRLKGKHPNSDTEIEVIGRYDTGGHTEGWEDNRGNWFFPCGWVDLTIN